VEHIALFPGHILIPSPRLRDAQHHGLWQLDAAVHEKFQCVVQHGRIRAVRLHDRIDSGNLLAQNRRGHRLLAGKHSVDVAADGVDLAVVKNDAVGMRPLPRGRGVGGEAGMHERKCRGKIRVLQIRIEFPQLPDQKQPLVYDRPAGHRYDVGAGDGMLVLAPGQIQFSVKIQAARGLFRAADKALRDCRHTALRFFAQNLRTDRHIPPEQQPQPFARQDHLQQLSAAHTFERILRKKDHGDAVIARFRKRFSRLPRCFFKKGIRKLRHNADAITGSAIGVLAGAVFKLFDDLQRVIYCPMRSLSADIDNGADPAGIMLAFLFGESLLMYLFHAFLSPLPL